MERNWAIYYLFLISISSFFKTKTVRMETPVMHLLIGEDGTKKQFKNLQNS